MSSIYKIMIGLPSGEVITVSQKIIDILSSKGLLWREAIFDGDNFVVHHIYNDSTFDKIIKVLSDIPDSELWE